MGTTGRLIVMGMMLWLSAAVLTAAVIELQPAPSQQWTRVPQAAAQSQHLTLPSVEMAPVIDGVLDDQAWQHASVVDQFQVQQGVDPEARNWAQITLADTGTALVVSGRMARPGGALQAEAQSRLDRVWIDHSFELFLYVPETGVRYQVIVNANAACWTGSSEKAATWQPELEVAAGRDDKAWQFELAVPWSTISDDGSRPELRVQMRYLQPNQQGFSAWSPATEPGEYPPVVAGDVLRSEAVQAVRYAFADAMAPGGNVVHVEVRNPSDQDRRAVARLTRMDGSPGIAAQQIVELPPGQVQRIALPLDFDGSDPFTCRLTVADAQQRQTVLSVTRRIRKLAPLEVRMDRERFWAGEQAATGRIELAVPDGEADAQLRVELWDAVHRLAQAEVAADHVQEVALRIPMTDLEPGSYRMRVQTLGIPEPQQQTLDLHVTQAMPLPAMRQIPLELNWPDTAPAAMQSTLSAPVYAGLALPAGMLADAQHVRVVDGQGIEVPLQTEVLATWGKGGTIRWLALRFVAQRGLNYAAEVGSDVQRAPAVGPVVQVHEGKSMLVIDTGAARFELPRTGPLFGRAWVGPTQILAGDAPCLLLADQHGTVADETRGDPSEAPVIEVAGPLQVIVRREGLLRTSAGERLGKYVVRLTFTAGRTNVPIQHSFIVTEDTSEVQFSDLALRVKPVLAGSWQVALDGSPEPHDGEVYRTAIDRDADEAIYLLQSVYRHHRQPEAEFSIGHKRGGTWEVVRQGAMAGQWGAAWAEGAGVAITRRQLAEHFPSEIEISQAGLTAHLWSSRGGRNLDYRPGSVARHVGEDWIDRAYPGGSEAFAAVQANGIGSARTSELCLHLLSGENPASQAEREAMLAEDPVLALQDPHWLRLTGVMGPVHPRDPQQFPRIEAFAEQFFDHCYQGQVERFGDYGFLDFGAGPHTYNGPRAEPGSDWPRLNYRYSNHDYQLRTSLWLAYARSGRRAYFDYAHAINRHISDFKFSYFDAPNKPYGAMISGYGSEGSMLYWQGIAGRFPAGVMGGHQGFDLENFLYQYYLTGDRRVMDGVRAFGDRFVRDFDPLVLPNVGATSNNSHPYGFAALLYSLDWDERYIPILQICRERLLDLDTTTGLANQDYYGAFYKTNVRMWGAVKDYQITGSTLAAQAIVKLARKTLRSDPDHSTGYQDHDGIFFQIATQITGDPRYRDWMNTRLRRLAFSYTTPDGTLRGMPYQGTHSSNIFETVAYGLDLLAREDEAPAPRPLLVSDDLAPVAAFYVIKPENEQVDLELRATRGLDVILTKLASPDRAKLRSGYSGTLQIVSRPPYFTADGDGLQPGHARVTLPAEAVGGIYEIRGASAILSSSEPRLVLAAPRGAYLDGGMVDAPPYYFHIPADQEGGVYVNKPATLRLGDQIIELSPGLWTDVAPASSERVASLHISGATFFRFRGGIPPVITRTPEGWFMPDPAIRPEPIPDSSSGEPFGPGVGGRAGNLAFRLGPDDLVLPRGKEIEPGVFEFFDTRRGTLEFWVKPRWSAAMVTEPQQRMLLQAGPWQLSCIIAQGDHLGGGRGITTSLEQNHFNLYVQPREKGIYQRLVNPASFWQEQWHHIAICWDTHAPEGWGSELYIDGRPSLSWNRSSTGLVRFAAHESSDPEAWQPGLPRAEIVLSGAFEAMVDAVHISDIPRYREPFTPQEANLPHPDEHTLLLMRLDGDTAAITPRKRAMP